jgi:hypothetical protein
LDSATARQQTQMSYEIFTAAEANDIKKLKELIAKGADVNAEDWDRGSTPLMWACAKGNFQAIELLLDAGADVNKQNRQGRTALHNLVSLRYDKIAIWLVKRGADPYIPDKKGFTPLDLALPFVQQEIKEALRKREQPGLDDDPDLKAASSKTYKQPTPKAEKAPDPVHIVDEDEILKIYLRNGSYKSVRVKANDTAQSVCELVAEKLSLPPGSGKYFELFEKIKNTRLHRFTDIVRLLIVSNTYDVTEQRRETNDRQRKSLCCASKVAFDLWSFRQ